ncbi:MAG: hypothetical protein JWM59_146 [Verrucomicrobiales bacterium]|nr:hypothetical protein [Verrucomicrobiales bacterium]
MNQESESRPKPGKRGFWKWLLAGTVLLIAVSVLVVLKSDDVLLPYDDLKVVEAPVPDIHTNGYLYLREKWGQWPRNGPYERVKAMANGQEPQDQAFIDRLRNGRANSVEDWRTALAMPEWRLPFPVSDGVETGSWMILPVQLLVFDAMISLRAGDAGPAIALQQEMALWIKRHLAGGDGITSVLVATAAMEMVADLGCGVLALGNPDSGQLGVMARVWGEEPLIAEAWQSAVRKDGAVFRSMMDQVQSGAGPFGEAQFRSKWREKLLFKKNRTLNAYHESLRKIVAAPFQPFPSLLAAQQAGYGLLPESDHPLLGQWNPNTTGNLFLRGTRGLGLLVLSQYKALFIPRAMKVRLAVHGWRRNHPSQRPSTLTELAPDFLPEVPKDPWNGAPLLWDHATGTVYAVGADWNPDPPVFPPEDRGWTATNPKAPGLRMALRLPASAAPAAPAYPAANVVADPHPEETE